MSQVNGIEMAIARAGGGPQGCTALAELMNVSVQAVYGFRKKGYFPPGRARVIAERYDLPLRSLVRPDLADALIA